MTNKRYTTIAVVVLLESNGPEWMPTKALKQKMGERTQAAKWREDRIKNECGDGGGGGGGV